ncbi:VOC family protein [Micromonospora sp. NPDC051296]|uniref:VOC family protein n=1 Tax=Micromonospora sp. NPDC051296 TaxID=3155046 RepID=UPI00342DBDAF
MSPSPLRVPGDLLVHLRRARDHLDRHYTEALDLAAVAAVAGISKHPSQPELQVNLTVPGPPLSPEVAGMFRRAQDEGSLFGIGLGVDDCRKTYDELRAKGVEFLQEPEERPYGVEAVARDNSGNWLVLVEPRESTPADFD